MTKVPLLRPMPPVRKHMKPEKWITTILGLASLDLEQLDKDSAQYEG